LCNGFKLRTSQEALQEKKVQILCRFLSVDSTGHVFANMNLKWGLDMMGNATIGLDFQNHNKVFGVNFSPIDKVIGFNYKLRLFKTK